MAYFSQDEKKKLAPAVKALCKEYGVKATLAVDNYSTFVVNIGSGVLDFFSDMVIKPRYLFNGQTPEEYRESLRDGGHIQVNTYGTDTHYTGKSGEFLTKLVKVMKGAGWYDNSDPMTDYFDTAYYIDINVGRWNKPYQLI